MQNSTTAADMPEFPLPLGHSFGPQGGSLMWHDGRSLLHERQALARWQRAYRERINRRWGGQATGVYDGDTQKAVIDLQTRADLPRTGLVDPATWAAVWTHAPSPRPAPPKVEKVPGRVRSSTRKSWHYWRRFSTFEIRYGTDPALPPWWPGRPFGPHEKGWHVREIQTLLGLKDTGTFNADTQARVRGVQRMHHVPISGVVDGRTALLIDPGPWPEEDE